MCSNVLTSGHPQITKTLTLPFRTFRTRELSLTVAQPLDLISWSCKVWTRAGRIRVFDHVTVSALAARHVNFSLRKHASSLRLSFRLHRLAIDAHSLVIPISRHILPQISLPTTLGSPRAASTTVARRLEDGEVGPSTTALSDKIIVYSLSTLIRTFYCLSFLSERLLASSFTLDLPYSTSRPLSCP